AMITFGTAATSETDAVGSDMRGNCFTGKPFHGHVHRGCFAMGRIWTLLKDTGEGFIADDALTRAAGIAYFTLFSVGPLLFIATGIASFAFGRDQVDDAITAQMISMLGEQAAREVGRLAEGAMGGARGGWAVAIGLGTLLLTAGGAFGALQNALNAVWKTEVPDAGSITETVSRFVKAKAAAVGLVATTGFILIASLAVSAAITSFGSWLEAVLPGGVLLAYVLNIAVTMGVLTVLFAAIYKVLPDRKLAWRDVFIGAFTTAVLFTVGKTLIALYIGNSNVAAGFGAASAIIIVLVWLYYSALIFLAGAEFTRAWANLNGTKQAAPVPAKPADAVLAPDVERRWLQPQSAPAVGRAPNAILQLLVALLPIVISGIVQGLMKHQSRAERNHRPRRG
ncbi:YihY/virulence factor BrkB family protein, partial [Paracraurococcus lichenis]